MAIAPGPYSHSIINEPSKLLICQHPETVPQKFTVILTVKVRSTSIGAGLRAIRQEATFRDLSTSIDSSNHRGHRRRRIGVGQGNDQEGPASNTLSYCPDSLFRPNFCPQRSGRSGAAPQRFGWAIGVQPSPPDHRYWVRAMSSTGAADAEAHQQRSQAMQARPRAAIPCEQYRPVWPRSSGRSRLAGPATTRHRPRSSAPTVRLCRR